MVALGIAAVWIALEWTFANDSPGDPRRSGV